MRKLLFIFLIGQLLLMSYIFNKSVYAIYELNNLGDSTLDAYIVEDFSGSTLNDLYDEINSACLSDDSCRLQLVKTPISSGSGFIYDIYHSQLKDINKPKSTSADKDFNYFPLTKEDFVDNDGIFYTDLPLTTLKELSQDNGVTIKQYDDNIAYSQILNFTLLNFIILLILTQLVLFIYTFTRIKVNAVKKMLGFSKIKMVNATLKDFLWMESVILITTLGIHYIYHSIQGTIVPRYFYFLVLFSMITILINIGMLMITQISMRFIDINLMLKNKVYSNRLNYTLYTIKIILIIAITVSVSSFMTNYADYNEKLKDVERYKQLEGFYTSNGYNSDENTKATNNPKLLKKYGDSVKEVYDYFDERDQTYLHDVSNIVNYLSSFYLERRGLKKEDIFADININYIVVNERYLKDFMRIKNEKGTEITDFNVGEPTLLAPAKYKSREAEIKKTYIEKYNDLLNYNENYEVSNSEPINTGHLDIIYTSNNQEFELLGKDFDEDDSSIKLKDTIIILDQGDFGSLYYLDQLNQGDLIFHLEERDEFSQILAKFDLTKLVVAGTLLTPYMDRVHFVEFIMHNSFVFTVLFLITLIFVIYISNYVDILSNRRKYAIQYIYGYNLTKTFKSHLRLYVLLLGMIAVSLFVEFNILFYITMLLVDFIILLFLYSRIIKNDIHKIVKGG